MGGACSVYRGEERRMQGFGGKSDGKRPLGRPRRRWEDNIKMDLQDVGCGCLGWIELARDRGRWRALVNAVMNLRVPQNAGNFLTSCKDWSASQEGLCSKE
jgi:hypothetical protein